MSAMLAPVRWRALFVALLLMSAAVLAHVTRPTVHIADQRGKVTLPAELPRTAITMQAPPEPAAEASLVQPEPEPAPALGFQAAVFAEDVPQHHRQHDEHQQAGGDVRIHGHGQHGGGQHQHG